MCGISVIVSNSPEVHSYLPEMTFRVNHRGPDANGFYEDGYVSMGHTRLKIIDLSDSANQPMHKNGVTIVFNGEIYNYKDLRKIYEELGYTFETDSDTEVILAAYAVSNTIDQFLQQLHGMFSFVIYDEKNHVVIGARDRFGIKPLYFKKINGGYAFASEIKQFSGLPDWKPTIDQEMANDFLTGGLVDHRLDRTIFEDVHLVIPGCFIRIDTRKPDELTHYRWYDLKMAMSMRETSSTFLTTQWLLKCAVQSHLQADVPVGSCLSGGIDSTSIVCLVNRIRKNGNRQKQVTVSSRSIAEFDEGHWINIVKTFCPDIIGYEVFPDAEEMFKKLPTVVYHQDTPFPTSSMYAQWCVFEEAKKHVKVMLDGQGSDEIFAGYHMYFGVRFASLMRSGKLYTLVNEMNAARKIPGYDQTFVMKCAASYFKSGIASVFDYSYDQVTRTSLPALLHWEDRNSMAHSVEARVPFLDHRLVEYTMALPEDKKISGGVTKVMLREAMRGLIPDEIVDRKDKIGFQTPETYWFDHRTDLFKSKYISVREHIPQVMRASCDDIVEKKKPYTSELWRAITYGEFMKCWTLA